MSRPAVTTMASKACTTYSTVRVGTRVYRVCSDSLQRGGGSKGTRATSPTSYNTAPLRASSRDEPRQSLMSNVEKMTAEVPCPVSYFGAIVGKGGATIKALTAETGAVIRVPKSMSTGVGAISISGTPEQVDAATVRIKVLVEKAANRPQGDFTHFLGLALPLPSEDCATHEALAAFQTQAFELAKRKLVGDGADPLVQIPPTEMHLTLAMLRLPNPEVVAKAVKAFRESSSAIYDAVGTRTVLVRLGGAACFGSPTKATTLHSRVDDTSGSVHNLTRVLFDRMIKEGLMPKSEAREPKLHLTVLRYLARRVNKKTEAPESGDAEAASETAVANPANSRPSFDCSEIIARLGDARVAEAVRIPAVVLYRRERREGPEGSEYVVEAKIGLP
ncbi:hypothetical protein AMAG_08291 [Allomyces macrogynus ATCC 38327]|uniref:K Homology domain-containing protein n=1 Tax=Allomyces macrogynus (strain ATCC 38327) TaxID=578462 RepID=A0A0L0SL16_ALLM3|nr:hypothetical protein AMAG_08291 [Allomyces macrogynus ATCC 38327]|eukprot:KNE63128.1 hypothetical protein AMAG_08291 [Allomyces macrogynus ATCC 38327]